MHRGGRRQAHAVAGSQRLLGRATRRPGAGGAAGTLPRRTDRAAHGGPLHRIIRSALHQAEQALTLRIPARLGAQAGARLAELAAAADDDGTGDGEPSALALIKSVPRNVSLESMLTEIGKLDTVRSVELPDDVGREFSQTEGSSPRTGGINAR